jgi:hypothetical protein
MGIEAGCSPGRLSHVIKKKGLRKRDEATQFVSVHLHSRVVEMSDHFNSSYHDARRSSVDATLGFKSPASPRSIASRYTIHPHSHPKTYSISVHSGTEGAGIAQSV